MWCSWCSIRSSSNSEVTGSDMVSSMSGVNCGSIVSSISISSLMGAGVDVAVEGGIIITINIMIIININIINIILDDLDSSRIGVVVCECGVSVFSPCGATG